MKVRRLTLMKYWKHSIDVYSIEIIPNSSSVWKDGEQGYVSTYGRRHPRVVKDVRAERNASYDQHAYFA